MNCKNNEYIFPSNFIYIYLMTFKYLFNIIVQLNLSFNLII